MSKNKKILMIVFSALVFLLLPVQASLAKEWTLQMTEDVNKAWKVRFSVALDAKSVQKSSVYVTDGKTTHSTSLKLLENGELIEVTPSTPYKIGTEYRIMITTDVKSKNGKSLKSAVEVPFEVIDSNANIKSIKSTNDKTITTLTVVTSNDVFDLKINNESLRYTGNNTYEHMLIGQKAGTVVTIYAYDVDGKRIETKKYTIQN